jgi:hypothetical protein
METRIIEINGVKLEIDLRTAKTVENYKVGDPVKVLTKHYDAYKSHPGVIIGFDAFKALPTIIIAYLEIEYSGASLKFVYLNAESKDVEICPANEKDMPVERARVIELLNKEITTSEEKTKELIAKRDYFINSFGIYFGDVAAK